MQSKRVTSSLKMSRMSVLYCALTVSACVVHVLASRSYDLMIDRIEEDPEIAEKYADFSGLSARKYNRTSMMVSGTVRILKPMPDDTIIDIKGNDWSGDRFDHSSHIRSKNMCELFESESRFLKEVADHSEGTWNGRCPIDMSEIRIKDLIIDNNRFPQQFSGDRWRLDTYGRVNGEKIAGMRLYVTVDRARELGMRD